MRVEMRLPFSRILKVCAPGILVPALMLQSAAADLVTVHLLDGKSHTVELVSVNRGVLQGKVNTSSDTPVQQFLRSQISYVDFPTTEEWRTAEAAYESGRFDEAVSHYRIVIADPMAHFYPMPGNFVSLAQVRILDCHRGRMVPADISKQAQVVREQFLNLPPSYRIVNPVVTAWKAVSEKNWGKVIESLEEYSPPTPESYFLKGVALEALGKSEEAMQEYAGAYVLNFGGVSNLTKEALKRSAELLIKVNNRDRAAELQAQVKIYRDLFGGGQLWEGAPDWVVKLSEAELNALVTDVEGDFEKPESAMEGGGTVVESNATDATLPPLSEREWMLPHEFEHRFFVMGKDIAANPVKLVGGAIETEKGIRFDGAGSAKLGGVETGSTIVKFRIKFVPEAVDGVLLDLRKGAAGFGLYLAAGEMILEWTPVRRGTAKEWPVAKVTPGQEVRAIFHYIGNGEIKGWVNDEPVSLQAGKRTDLGLKGINILSIGDISDTAKQKSAAKGGRYLPFKGLIEHVSIGTGRTAQEVRSDEMLTLGGKIMRFSPPPPATPEPVPPEKPAPAKPKAAPEKPGK